MLQPLNNLTAGMMTCACAKFMSLLREENEKEVPLLLASQIFSILKTNEEVSGCYHQRVYYYGERREFRTITARRGDLQGRKLKKMQF